MKRTIATAVLALAAAFPPATVHAQDASTAVSVPLMLPASDAVRQSFVRLINESSEAGAVRIVAVDDGGNAAEPIEIRLAANSVLHFNSGDLTDGNASKGIDGIGSPREGSWRLRVETALDVQVLSFIRTRDGFLTAMHDVLPRDTRGRLLVRTFNPASNRSQRSSLRLVNAGVDSERVTIAGVDDAGSRAGPVTLTLAAGQSRTLSAVGLEEGSRHAEGTLGDGAGKWQLLITASRTVTGMSLLETPSGHLTNLSTAGVAAAGDTGGQPTERFRDCAECPLMAVVPAGTFMMGAPESEFGSGHLERPVHAVSVPSFAVGVYEVTFAEWDACVASPGCGDYRLDVLGWGRDDRPVIDVNWDDAKRYVEWLSKKTGETYRLLSESEWEYAARAGTTTPFHTGATITAGQANYNGRYSYPDPTRTRDPNGIYREQTMPVGSFGANAWGLHDVHGNVYEWVEDCWNDSYAGAPSDGSAWLTDNCGARVLRGGSWIDFPAALRAANRSGLPSGARNVNIGFRVARTLTP